MSTTQAHGFVSCYSETFFVYRRQSFFQRINLSTRCLIRRTKSSTWMAKLLSKLSRRAIRRKKKFPNRWRQLSLFSSKQYCLWRSNYFHSIGVCAVQRFSNKISIENTKLNTIRQICCHSTIYFFKLKKKINNVFCLKEKKLFKGPQML